MTRGKWRWPKGQSPSSEFRALIEGLDFMLIDWQSVFRRVVQQGDGRYESNIAAVGLGLLCLNYASAVANLARLGLDSFAPACASARGALEVAARGAWLVQPDDPMDREGRWLGWYGALERLYANLAADFRSHPQVAESMATTSQHYMQYRRKIEALLPTGHKAVGAASVEQMLIQLAAAQLYPLYRYTSQYQHGEPLALESVVDIKRQRANPTDSSPIYEVSSQTIQVLSRATEASWVLPVQASSNALALCAEHVFPRSRVAQVELARLKERFSVINDHLNAMRSRNA